MSNINESSPEAILYKLIKSHILDGKEWVLPQPNDEMAITDRYGAIVQRLPEVKSMSSGSGWHSFSPPQLTNYFSDEEKRHINLESSDDEFCDGLRAIVNNIITYPDGKNKYYLGWRLPDNLYKFREIMDTFRGFWKSSDKIKNLKFAAYPHVSILMWKITSPHIPFRAAIHFYLHPTIWDKNGDNNTFFQFLLHQVASNPDLMNDLYIQNKENSYRTLILV